MFDLAESGPLPAIGHGDTSIGRTIEAALEIPMNCNPAPDFKGIELKAKRKRSKTRNGLFAQVPDWRLSEFKSSEAILEHFGYESSADFRLYCTVSTRQANAQGLILEMKNDLEQLHEIFRQGTTEKPVCVWTLEKLHARLQDKHRETFWIGADEEIIGSKRFFRLHNVRHTRHPSNSHFDRLLTQGDVIVDHMIKKAEGKRAREKGPQFKVNRGVLNELFLGAPREYRL